MIRIAASICFALTLLCPVFCLANTADECTACASADGENCEAMSIGAVVEKLGTGVSMSERCLPSFDDFVSPDLAALKIGRGLRSAVRRGEETRPPTEAARRHALLQTFLF